MRIMKTMSPAISTCLVGAPQILGTVPAPIV
jgi:hypothetical protein